MWMAECKTIGIISQHHPHSQNSPYNLPQVHLQQAVSWVPLQHQACPVRGCQDGPRVQVQARNHWKIFYEQSNIKLQQDSNNFETNSENRSIQEETEGLGIGKLIKKCIINSSSASDDWSWTIIYSLQLKKKFLINLKLKQIYIYIYIKEN